MSASWRVRACDILPLAASVSERHAVELRVSRDTLECTLRHQLFRGPTGRYCLKESPQSPRSVYAEDAKVSFVQGRVLLRLRTRARMGKSMGGSCLGISLAPAAEVSVAPYGKGETIGFRDAQLVKVGDQRESQFPAGAFPES